MPKTKRRRRKPPSMKMPSCPALRALVGAALERSVDAHSKQAQLASQQAAVALQQMHRQGPVPTWLQQQSTAQKSFADSPMLPASLPRTDAPELYPFI